MQATLPRPYRIDVPDDVLADLRERLGRTRWPEQMPGAGWDFGANLDYIRSLCEYWRDKYDWRAQERRLNEYPQFLCEVDGVDIHYWHVKGKGPNPFPLMLIHGWPGSIVEFYDVIGPLTDPAAHGGDAADAFDLVIPALPGFGFSGHPRERGWGTRRIAAAFDELMTKRLGYERYGAQGGDLGRRSLRPAGRQPRQQHRRGSHHGCERPGACVAHRRGPRVSRDVRGFPGRRGRLLPSAGHETGLTHACPDRLA